MSPMHLPHPHPLSNPFKMLWLILCLTHNSDHISPHETLHGGEVAWEKEQWMLVEEEGKP